jgi:AcrR family transcriptional regulator
VKWLESSKIKGEPGKSEDLELATKSKKAKKTNPPRKLTDRAKLLRGEKIGHSPGPKPSLSVDQIVRAAVAVADAEGLGPLSMQRVAREVRVTTMALYRYLNSKAELIGLMMETAGGPVPDLGMGTTRWRSRLEEWTRHCSAIYRDHPWFLQAATAPQRIMGPNELGWLDAALRALADAGLTAREQHEAFLVLMGHVRSNAEFMALRVHSRSGAPRASAMAKLLRDRDRYPALAAEFAPGAFRHSSEGGLEFGLKCILNGIESLARKRGR